MVRASHILMAEADLEKLKSLKTDLANGADFGELATEFSTCPSGATALTIFMRTVSPANIAVLTRPCLPGKKKQGDLGLFAPGSMVKEFDEVCFNEDYEVGVVHGPIKTQFGYHLINITVRE